MTKRQGGRRERGPGQGRVARRAERIYWFDTGREFVRREYMAPAGRRQAGEIRRKADGPAVDSAPSGCYPRGGNSDERTRRTMLNLRDKMLVSRLRAYGARRASSIPPSAEVSPG